MATETTSPMLPYVAFSALTGFLETLKQLPSVPQHIDKDMMDGMSGATQSHLNSALKSLGLVRSSGQATETLSSLVAAYGTDDWKEALDTLIKETYAGVLGDLDIESASLRQLRSRFKEAGLEGSMLDRSVRFYINALKEAGVSFSPLFTKRRKATKGGNQPGSNGRRQQSNSKNSDTQSVTPPSDGTPSGWIDIPIPLTRGGSYIRVPKNIEERQMPIVAAVVSVVEQMAKQNSEETD